MQKITDAYKQQRPGAQQASRPGKQPGELPASQLHEGSGVGAPAPPAAAAVAAAPAATAERREDPSGADADEKALRQFDLDTRFGPCSGMSRLERWERAVQLGLDPPVYVRELVLRHGEDSMFNRNLWEHPY